MEPKVLWSPTPKQEEFLSAPEEEILYGGAAGGGKTDALVIDALGLWQEAPLDARYRAILLRRTFPELREVIDRAQRLYPTIVPGAEYHVGAKEWRFPSGAKLLFGYAERVSDVYQYQGQEFQYIGWEELTQWPTDECYNYLLTRLRGTRLKKLVRSTCNPGGVGSRWVQERFGISDDGSPTVIDGSLDVDGQRIVWRRRFIPARLSDNPYLGADYKAQLLKQTENQRKALLDGRWDVQDIPGQIYKTELETARAEGRITRVPYDPSVPVYTFFDLGIGDSTAIWFVQLIGREVHLIDYYEASGEALSHYVGVMESKPYRYAEDNLPHDAKARELGTGKTREEMFKANGRKVRIVPNIGVEDGINAARLLFPMAWFDAEKCKRGIECLTNYRREYNEKMGEFKATPVHDWASHGADAFRYVAVGLKERKAPKREFQTMPKRTLNTGRSYGGTWM
jgi:hypothetical protein